MSISDHKLRYEIFLKHFRAARKASGLTQVEVARRLSETQTYVSKCERGERRIDIIDLIEFLEVYDADYANFMTDLRSQIRSAGLKVGS